MTIILYGFLVSPPLRADMLVCEALDIKYKMKEIDPFRGDHLKPDYLKINPLHSIPTMEDGDYILFNSHAIACYLANRYEKGDVWYPKDPRSRGIVDQRLHFNDAILGPPFKEAMVPVLRGLIKHPNQKAVEKIKDAVQQLDRLLADNDFLAGFRPTIADCCASAVVISIEEVFPQCVTPRVAAWLRRCERALPGFQKINQQATQMLCLMKSKL